MKLNYTSLQHVVAAVEEERLELPLQRPVAVLALHGQLAAVAWAFAQRRPRARLGYVQTGGGALPGGHSRTVRTLRERGLLAGHLTAGAAFGGEGEAVTAAGALHHGLRSLGWDAAICGPGPGIVGSGSPLGHGGMVGARLSARGARAGGCPTLVVARMSSGDRRARHRGISHHTLTVLDLLLEPVTVALPAGMRSPVGTDLRAGLGAVFGDARAGRTIDDRPALPLDVERPIPDRQHASPATTGAARRSTCRPTRSAACPRGRWGEGWRKTRCSSARRSRAAERWRRCWPRTSTGKAAPTRPPDRICAERGLARSRSRGS